MDGYTQLYLTEVIKNEKERPANKLQIALRVQWCALSLLLS